VDGKVRVINDTQQKLDERAIELGALSDRHNELKDQFEAEQLKISSLNSQIDDIKSQLVNREAKISRLEGNITDIKSTSKQNLDDIEAKRERDMLNQKRDLKSQYAENFRKLQENHTDALNEAKGEAEKEVSSVEAFYIAELSKHQEHQVNSNREIQGLKQSLESAQKKYAKDQKQAEEELNKERETHEKEVEKLEIQIATLETKLENEKRKFENEKRKLEAAVEARLKNKMKKVVRRNDKLVEELVFRRNFKGLTDREICQRFTALANEVDDISRTAWDHKRENSWPFPEKVLDQPLNGTNFRELTQQIIQNSIWIILFERIFGTPFKIFGDEGDNAQMSWTDEYGIGTF
jgi:chromosome segregation ATPase